MSSPKVLTLEVLPAKKGDCLLLHYGTRAERKLWLIDGGPSGVYKRVLKKRLNTLRGEKQLKIELLMVSHHDDDHIKGLLDMCDDLETTVGEKPYEFHELWHNSWQQLADVEEKSPPSEVTVALGGDEHDDLMLANVEQGFDLGRFANKFDWPVNRLFQGDVVGLGRTTGSRVAKFAPLALTIIGPMPDEIEKLRREYQKFLKARERGDAAAATAALASYEDTSPANLSSIVVLVEYEGKSILLTGDARGDTILEGLTELGLIGGGKVLQVDVLKMPHHGSARNVEPDFFESIVADHYVFSGDGSHGNPERETLEMLFNARGKAPFTLHFNHALDAIDPKRVVDWDKEERRKKKNNPAHVIRPWKTAKQGVAQLLTRQASAGGAKFKVAEPVAEGAHLMLDLLDPVTA